MPDSDQPTCGLWMPKAKTYCGRKPLHRGKCVTPEALAQQVANRPRKTGRRRGQVDPAGPARWRAAYRLSRFNITQKFFDWLLEIQGYRCAFCQKPFAEDEYIYIDHDHRCCPVPPRAQTRCCGGCVRGLVHFRCNTIIGYVEKYASRVAIYLDDPLPGDPWRSGHVA